MKKISFVCLVIALSGSLFVSFLSVLLCYLTKFIASTLFVMCLTLAIGAVITTIATIVVVERWRKVEDILRNVYNYRIDK